MELMIEEFTETGTSVFKTARRSQHRHRDHPER